MNRLTSVVVQSRAGPIWKGWPRHMHVISSPQDEARNAAAYPVLQSIRIRSIVIQTTSYKTNGLLRTAHITGPETGRTHVSAPPRRPARPPLTPPNDQSGPLPPTTLVLHLNSIHPSLLAHPDSTRPFLDPVLQLRPCVRQLLQLQA